MTRNIISKEVENMATTVISSFNEFLKNSVNLDPKVVSEARKSRDNLLNNISTFSVNEGFFTLWKDINCHFGSFARKTKCRELDDIDLMIGISANGATYNQFSEWNNVKIFSSKDDEAQNQCSNTDGTLNSTKVINLFKKKLKNLNDYSHSELHKNGEAIVLNLVSKSWSFDIVPCFLTKTELDGRSYYLIPNGAGAWKKTDPIKDREYVIKTNQNNNGRVLELIRLAKKWNTVKNVKTMPSYMIETMVINFANSAYTLSDYIDINICNLFKYIADNIINPVNDMKEIQGNINTLDIFDKIAVKDKATSDYEKACHAIKLEQTDNKKLAIKEWGEIFGSDFPEFG